VLDPSGDPVPRAGVSFSYEAPDQSSTKSHGAAFMPTACRFQSSSPLTKPSSQPV
jgi:hypothetical protein